MIKQKRVVIYITDQEHKMLKARLALIGKTVSGWAREAIRRFLYGS
jgi:hypothetical protein